ncbi:MAG: CTP synthase [Candidatus Micrarchaeota archaeon]|nr:MAG: CTP synthase [Candidatus Micrarchaeota archaeon]
MQTKYIVVLGSLLSGIGKGVITSSILKILDMYNIRAIPIKFDGYLNVDCGTMNPFRHGEVFVLDDGAEVDMDFGMYERFLNKDLDRDLSLTSGKIFSEIIEKERRGDYLGYDVQVVPHLIEFIKDKIRGIAKKREAEVVVIEVGGTVGDLENSYFIEAMRSLSTEEDTVFVVVTYVLKPHATGEQKTKPAQLGLRAVMSYGIKPSYVVCRSEDPLEGSTIEKISSFGSISKERVIDARDLETIYEMPLHLINQGFDKLLLKDICMEDRAIDKDKYNRWSSLVNSIKSSRDNVKIGIVGKYVTVKDAYISVKEALVHASAYLNIKPEIYWIDSESIEREGVEVLKDLHGIIVPGGFGARGTEGMIKSIEFSRLNKIPYLGLCLGMQLMCIEYARDVCNIKDATSEEFNPGAEHKIIVYLPTQRSIQKLGGTMRLGLYEAVIKDNSIAKDAYKREIIRERHRHRYELNNDYREILEKAGLKITGVSPDNKLVEIVEWSQSFGIGTQAHPELRSRLEKPSELFLRFLEEAYRYKQDKGAVR